MAAHKIVFDVMLKLEYLDPAGSGVANALPNLGFGPVVSLRISKHI